MHSRLTRHASPPCAAPNSISAFVAPKMENQVPGGGLCPLRRIRQDAQINYLSTLSIFMKQTTYLATLPKPKIRKEVHGRPDRSVPKEQIEEILKEHP